LIGQNNRLATNSTETMCHDYKYTLVFGECIYRRICKDRDCHRKSSMLVCKSLFYTLQALFSIYYLMQSGCASCSNF